MKKFFSSLVYLLSISISVNRFLISFLCVLCGGEVFLSLGELESGSGSPLSVFLSLFHSGIAGEHSGFP